MSILGEQKSSAQALKCIDNQLDHRLRFEKRAMSEVTALSQPEFVVASCALKKCI
jgi:hypothetical protein